MKLTGFLIVAFSMTIACSDASAFADLAPLSAKTATESTVSAREDIVVESCAPMPVTAWQRLGWQPRAGDRVALEEVCDSLGIVEQYHRLARAQLQEFGKHRWLRALGDDVWEVVGFPAAADTGGSWAALAAEFPDFAPEAKLHELVTPHLVAVMSGDQEPMNILFPGGSSEYVERLYAQINNFPGLQGIGAAFDCLLQNWPAGRRPIHFPRF